MRGALWAALLVCLCLWAQGCGGGERPAERASVESRLQRTLEGHAEVVWQVAFSPDSRWLASSGYDNTVKLYTLETRRQ